MRTTARWPLVLLALAVAVAVAGCGADDECTSHAMTFCTDGVNYWMNSCGEREEPVQTCECGCADQTSCRPCSCVPQCDGRVCGPDGCGGSCAPGCGIGQICTAEGTCEMCEPSCEGRVCGDDGCGGTCPPGCGAGEACRADGTCEVCEPDCAGRVCGDDGCGGSCGECGVDERCTDDGTCVGCTRDCTDRFCGDDGCGGSCGECGAGLECSAEGQCVEPVCGDVPFTIAGPFETDVADVTFDGVAVAIDHKIDIDAFEDGCITRIEVSLTRGTGCRLDVVAAGRYTADGGLVVESVAFAADSFCPGFADDDEGEYVGALGVGGELDVALVVPGVTEVPGETAAESCVATSFAVRLEGALRRTSDDRALAIGATEIVVTGEALSIGDTETTCPCVPDCADRVCGPDGCGATCGACEDGARCTDDGVCLARPAGTCFDEGAWRDKATPAAGDVVITELMANPQAVSDSDGEWFELWLARDLDLNGLTAGRDPLAEPDLVIPEGDCRPVTGGRHIVFARSSDETANGGLADVVRTFGFSLANGDGRLFVGYEDAILDVVTWSTVRDGDARVLEPTATDAALNDDDYYWCDADTTYGLGDRGTPGDANPSCGIPLATCTEGGVARDKVVPEVGDLVITELMPDPSAATDADGEWFEVYVARDVDLNGLQLGRDELGSDPVVGEGECVRVAAGTRLLFARDTDPDVNGGLPGVTALFDVNLVNGNGALRIGVANTDIDVVTWTSAPTGASLQLDPAARSAAGNDASDAWCDGVSAYGAGDLGTPAAPNVACP